MTSERARERTSERAGESIGEQERAEKGETKKGKEERKNNPIEILSRHENFLWHANFNSKKRATLFFLCNVGVIKYSTHYLRDPVIGNE
jgi:hypothetical protein